MNAAHSHSQNIWTFPLNGPRGMGRREKRVAVPADLTTQPTQRPCNEPLTGQHHSRRQAPLKVVEATNAMMHAVLTTNILETRVTVGEQMARYRHASIR